MGTKDNENLHASIVGMVDYLTRASLGAKALDAFEVSLKGYNLGLLDDALNLVEISMD